MPLIQRLLPYPHWEFTTPGGEQALRLVPERGGLVTGWRAQGQELLYLDQQRFADPSLSVRGGIPVLFPICGGLPPGSSLLPQHGFARDCPWSHSLLADGQGVAMQLEDDARTRALFPHAFTLSLEYRLAPTCLEITARVRNRGRSAMPYSLGLHPYFAVSGLDRLELTGLPATCLDQVSNTEVATADQLARLSQGVDLLADPGAPVRLLDPGAGRALRLETSSPLDLVVIWTDPPRPMVCLEPWTAPRGALLSGERLLSLEPGQEQELGCRYRLEIP
jgi:Galactose mutarotase and related enzymes